jgi:large subunit ribosomal protein L7/L12
MADEDQKTPLRTEDGAAEGQAQTEETTTETEAAPPEATPAEEVKVEEPAAVEQPPAALEPAKEEPKPEKAAPSGKFAQVITQIENLSALELAELVKALEERFGVSAAAPMMMAGAIGAGAAGAPVEVAEEKTHYTLHLTEAGSQKIAVIKAIREILPDLGLKEAKDLVDAAPKVVKENMPKADAEEGKKKLEAAGGKAELK